MHPLHKAFVVFLLMYRHMRHTVQTRKHETNTPAKGAYSQPSFVAIVTIQLLSCEFIMNLSITMCTLNSIATLNQCVK